MGRYITVDASVEIDLNDYTDEILEIANMQSEEAWEEIHLKIRHFGADALKRHIEDQLFERYGFRYQL